VRQKADMHEYADRPVTGVVTPLQRLMMAAGARMREALWAAQLVERKAAVARWRTGQFRRSGGRPLPHGKEWRR
jgi:hypothetical protein